jgi:hypothetical protein
MPTLTVTVFLAVAMAPLLSVTSRPTCSQNLSVCSKGRGQRY